MNRLTTITRILAALLALGLFALTACENEENPGGGLLSEGAYPVTFTTSGATPLSQSPNNFYWGVQIDGVVKKYYNDTKNDLHAADGETPFYWQSITETKNVSAWRTEHDYYGGLTSWSVQPDQSTAQGYEKSILYYATPTPISFGGNNLLSFYPQPAMVHINIKDMDFVTDATKQNMEVTIGNAAHPISLTGAIDPSNPNEYKSCLRATPGNDGHIIPGNAATSVGYLKSYSAYVIPQDMESKPFIFITLGGVEYFYVPTTGEADLKGGSVYTYNITVNEGSLDVQVERSGEWIDCGSSDVNTTLITTYYMPDDLKPGDFFYRTPDGGYATSDGGVRTVYGDGCLDIEQGKVPDPSLGTVVGIVFCTDLSRIGESEKEALRQKGVDTPHGLVMATKAALSSRWGPVDNTPGFEFRKTTKDCYEDISGLRYSEIIWGKGDMDYALFMEAKNLNGTHTITGTTGWFPPSMGQWWDILCYLGQAPWMAKSFYKVGAYDLPWSFAKQGPVVSNLNFWLNKVQDSDRDIFSNDGIYWSSSVYSDNDACLVRIAAEEIEMKSAEKSGQAASRYILAF